MARVNKRGHGIMMLRCNFVNCNSVAILITNLQSSALAMCLFCAVKITVVPLCIYISDCYFEDHVQSKRS